MSWEIRLILLIYHFNFGEKLAASFILEKKKWKEEQNRLRNNILFGLLQRKNLLMSLEKKENSSRPPNIPSWEVLHVKTETHQMLM